MITSIRSGNDGYTACRSSADANAFSDRTAYDKDVCVGLASSDRSLSGKNVLKNSFGVSFSPFARHKAAMYVEISSPGSSRMKFGGNVISIENNSFHVSDIFFVYLDREGTPNAMHMNIMGSF